jgi:hypothetical protein
MTASLRTRKTAIGKRTKFALARSAKEILAHVKGETTLPTGRIVLANDVDVRRIPDGH